MAAGPQTLPSPLESQQGCSVSRGAQVPPLLGGLPRLMLSCDQLQLLQFSQKKVCFPPVNCYESAASPARNLFYSSLLIIEVTHGQAITPSATHTSPSIFPYLHESSLFPAQESSVCSSSGVVGAAGSQLHLQLPTDTTRQPPAPSLAARLLH